MIKLFGPTVPNEIYVACSGGVDSMCALTYLANKPYRKVTAVFFHHATEHSEKSWLWLKKYLLELNIPLVFGGIISPKPPKKSQEHYWRDERYKFLHSLPGPVITAHHLDDCVETWLFSAMHGQPKTIPYANRNVVRPFLLNKKEEMISWCEFKGIKWIEDASNNDVKYMRNLIRHRIVPEALKVNPGLHKVIARQVKKAYEENNV
jgi:tRNA(Ile)-lysidine synthase